MNAYKVTIRYQHRKWGADDESYPVEAGNIRVAINRALGTFFQTNNSGSLKNRSAARERRQAHLGVTITALRLGPCGKRGKRAVNV